MRHTRVAGAIALALAVSGLGAGIALSSSASAASTKSAHSSGLHHQSVFYINVPARNSWTYPSIYVSQGQQVNIQASGTIHPSRNTSSGPAGKPFPSGRCGYYAYTSGYTFLVPGVNCWAMVFSVGGYQAFPTGTAITFVSPVSGWLQLGVNDNYFNDNSGSFTARVAL